MIVKIHETEGKRMMLAVCDSDILGKKFEEGNKQLDLTSNFYKGDEMSDKEAAELMKNAYIINIVGKNAVTLAINNDLINGEHVEEIDGTPYAQGVVAEK